MKRIANFVLAALAVFTLASGVLAQSEEKTGTLRVDSPASFILSGKGDDAVRYDGTVHVQVFAASPELKKKAGNDPVGSEDVGRGLKEFTLPVGRYEVNFSIRDGVEMKTTIKTVVIHNKDISLVVPDFSAAKTLTYGSGMTAQQMEGVIRELARRLAALQVEVAALKGGTKAVPAPPAPTDTPAPAPTDAPAK